MTEQARHYGSLALPEISEHGAPWSRSLVLIDLALVDMQDETETCLDRAAGLVLEALRISTGRPVISVSKRTAEFLRVARKWDKTPQISALTDTVRALGAS